MIRPAIFDKYNVKAFFTTKVSLSSDIDAISKIFNVPLGNIYLPVQQHTDNVVLVDYDIEPEIADAAITNRKGILIGVQAADCVPVTLYDKRLHVVGAVHAGWRGTAAEILKKTIKFMMSRFYCLPADILIAFGPAIRWCCYDVDQKVAESVSITTGDGDYFIKKGEKYYLDLPTANKHQAISSDVPLKNIWMSDECTFCLPKKYHSYRFDKGTTERQCGFIGIMDDYTD